MLHTIHFPFQHWTLTHKDNPRDNHITPDSHDTTGRMSDDNRISPELLSRLIQEFLENGSNGNAGPRGDKRKTRISQPALNLLGEYFDVFVREAIWRAAAVRKETFDVTSAGGKDLVGSGILFVEVPQSLSRHLASIGIAD